MTGRKLGALSPLTSLMLVLACGGSDAGRVIADFAEEHLDGLASLPFFSKLLLDPEGNVWARDHGVTGSDSDTWTVFDPEEVWLGALTMPTGLDVLSIGSDHVVSRSRDELGVESVAVHELTKP